MIKLLKLEIAAIGSQSLYADKVQETQPRISAMLHGKLAMSSKVLSDLKIKKIEEPFFELTYT